MSKDLLFRDMFDELCDAQKTTYQLEQHLLAEGNTGAAELYTERYRRIKALLAKAEASITEVVEGD